MGTLNPANIVGTLKGLSPYTQNPGFSAYTQHWVLYTWDELTISISQVGKPLHEFDEDSNAHT